MEWHDIKETVPRQKQRVLVLINSVIHDAICLDGWVGGFKTAPGIEYGSSLEGVTHWMECPKMPRNRASTLVLTRERGGEGMNHCKDCYYWGKHEYGTWGDCFKLISHEQELFDLSEHYCERDTEVETHPDFGCVLWEMKE